MYMIMLVLDDPEQLEAVVGAWEIAGIRGVTMLESTGLGRLRQSHVPARYYFQSARVEQEGHVTLLAVVPDDEKVRTCLRITEEITGDLDEPHTGLFTAWPLLLAKGAEVKVD
jgi:nitrogen regulatory protein PII